MEQVTTTISKYYTSIRGKVFLFPFKKKSKEKCDDDENEKENDQTLILILQHKQLLCSLPTDGLCKLCWYDYDDEQERERKSLKSQCIKGDN